MTKTPRALFPALAMALVLMAAPLAADSIVTSDAFLPIVHTVGATGTYVTDVSVFNPSATESVEVRFYFGAADTDGTNGPGFRLSPDLYPRETVTLKDILKNYFEIPSGYGLLEVQSSKPILVISNTYNVAGGCPGTLGQFSPGQPERSSVGFGTTNDYNLYVAGIPHDGVHRTNATFMNPTAKRLLGTMELVDGAGQVWGRVKVQVPPYSMHQLNDVFGQVFRTLNPPADPAWRLNFYIDTNTGATLLAYVTIIDVRSGDPYLVPAQAQVVNVPARPEPLGATRPEEPIGVAPLAAPLRYEVGVEAIAPRGE